MPTNAWTEDDLKRWMRADAHRFLPPDWRRCWPVSQTDDSLYRFYERVERKFSVDRPRVPAGSSNGGRWTGDSRASERQFRPSKDRAIDTGSARLACR